MNKISGIDKKKYFKKYYYNNKNKYINSYTKRQFRDELDKKYPNRIDKRKQYYYKYMSQTFKHRYIPITITWYIKDNYKLSYD